MLTNRREVLQRLALAAAAALPPSCGRATGEKSGIPGPYRGRVVAVEHAGSIIGGSYQEDSVGQMMRKGMTALTGAPDWPSAWRVMFGKGDVVGIKVSPVGGPKLCSDATVLRTIFDGLKEAGVTARDVVVFSRYGDEFLDAGIDKWVPAGSRWHVPTKKYDDFQLDMDGYDPDQFMEMAVVKLGENPNDAHLRRSYVARLVTKEVNKIINLPVLKHHQSAGVTICLKNLSHGCVNNVFRSHQTPTLNVCGQFIPSVVALPVFRQKVVLHIVDGVRAAYHGGPGGRPKYMWEHKTMYFGTDPVALDKTGWKVIDAKRQEVGMEPIALSKPDHDSTFLNCQVEHIEIASTLELGAFKDDEIDVNRFKLA